MNATTHAQIQHMWTHIHMHMAHTCACTHSLTHTTQHKHNTMFSHTPTAQYTYTYTHNTKQLYNTNINIVDLPNHFPLKTVPNDPDPILSPISSSEVLISQVLPESLVFCITRKSRINKLLWLSVRAGNIHTYKYIQND